MATLTDMSYMQLTKKFSRKTDFEHDGYDLVVQENLDYLKLYDSVKVPTNHRYRIIDTLISLGHVSIEKLIGLLANTTGDKILMNQYIHTLMYHDTINFDIHTPLEEDSEIWIDIKYFDI